jgi:hypothetical protein
MDEKVLAIILLDATVAFFLVKPFHLSFSHRDIPPFSSMLLSLNKSGYRSGQQKRPLRIA